MSHENILSQIKEPKILGDLEIATYALFFSITLPEKLTLKNFPFCEKTKSILNQLKSVGSQWEINENILTILTPLKPESSSTPLHIETDLELAFWMTWFAVSQSVNTILIPKKHQLQSNTLALLKQVLSWESKESNGDTIYLLNAFSTAVFSNPFKSHLLTKIVGLFSHLLLLKPIEIPHIQPSNRILENLIAHFKFPIEYNTPEVEKAPQNPLEERLSKLQSANKKEKKSIQLHLNKNHQFSKNYSLELPNDILLASFYSTLAIFTPKAKVKLSHIYFSADHNAFFNALKKMGAEIQVKKQTRNNDTIAQIQIEYSHLKGQRFSLESIQKMIRQIPFLIFSSTLAEGKTIIRHLNYFRHTQIDLLHLMHNTFKKAGADIGLVEEDGIVAKGRFELEQTSLPVASHLSIAMMHLLLYLLFECKIQEEDLKMIEDAYPLLGVLLK